jgi:hypothetical protein
MRPIKLLLALLFCALPVRAVTPANIQTCKSVNGGAAKQNYIITIGSSGGSTGCTSDYTATNALILAYHQQAGSTDRATGNISVTGATITWHKAGSIQNSVFAPPGYFTGIFYACGGDITSPTNAIQITLDMGASMAGITATYAQEVSNIHQSSCLDASTTDSACCSGDPFITALSGTLASASEYVFSTAVTISGSNPVLAPGSVTGCPSTCFVFDAIPAQGSDNQSTTATAIESVAVVVTTSKVWSFHQSPAGLAQNQVGITLISDPAASNRRGPKGKLF